MGEFGWPSGSDRTQTGSTHIWTVGPEADIGTRHHIWNVTDINCVAVAGVGNCSSLAAHFVGLMLVPIPT